MVDSEFLKSKKCLVLKLSNILYWISDYLKNAFKLDLHYYAFTPPFIEWQMHSISIVGLTIPIFLKIIWKKEYGLQMSGFFQDYVQNPRSKDPGF